MRLRFLARPFACLSVILLPGCLSTRISLDYVSNPASQRSGPPMVAVGVFQDKRDEEEPLRLGTVKTPLGLPLEKVYLRVPVDETVENAFLHGLVARGMMAKPGRARFVFEGEIEDFTAEVLVRPHAYVKLQVSLVDAGSHRVLQRHVYEAERQAGNFLFGEGDPLPWVRDLASRVLQDAVDKAIDDPRMREWIDIPTHPPGEREGLRRRPAADR